QVPEQPAKVGRAETDLQLDLGAVAYAALPPDHLHVAPGGRQTFEGPGTLVPGEHVLRFVIFQLATIGQLHRPASSTSKEGKMFARTAPSCSRASARGTTTVARSTSRSSSAADSSGPHSATTGSPRCARS